MYITVYFTLFVGWKEGQVNEEGGGKFLSEDTGPDTIATREVRRVLAGRGSACLIGGDVGLRKRVFDDVLSGVSEGTQVIRIEKQSAEGGVTQEMFFYSVALALGESFEGDNLSEIFTGREGSFLLVFDIGELSFAGHQLSSVLGQIKALHQQRSSFERNSLPLCNFLIGSDRHLTDYMAGAAFSVGENVGLPTGL